jgi:phage tail sheath protein FI
MAFQLSAGVNVSEIDLTTIVPGVSASVGAFVGTFNWGPANTVLTVSDEIDLVNKVGKPDTNTFTSFFTAANFLSYANNLKLVRAINPTVAKNATSNGGSLLITNRDTYVAPAAYGPATNATMQYAARYPGSLGNSLKVSVCANTNGFSSWAYSSYFQSAPNTSTWGATNNGLYDEMHILVLDEEGAFSGVANTVLERWSYVSKAADAKNEDGSSNYYVNVLNDRSQYVVVTNHGPNTNWGITVTSNSTSTTFNAGEANTYSYSMSNGVYSIPSDGDISTAYTTFFKNADEIDISLIMTGAHSTTVTLGVIDNIAEFRKDSVVFISPQSSDVVNKPGLESAAVQATKTAIGRSSSYAFMDCNWKYQFDKYNNVYRWVPLNGDIAGLCARTDEQRDPWYSPAGFNRGQIKNVVKLAWNPNKTQRDDLYKVGINPVVTFAGDGTVLYGDKTLLAKPSAFDRINVRRLFIVLEKAIARASKYSLFEFNDEFTRAQFVSLVEPFLRDVQGRRGIFDFRVVCDTTNNTPEVIDRNEFVGDIYIKPARSINFIQLNFVAVRTGVAFEEIVGKF